MKQRGADLRSDVTALVGIFYSCITGRPPIVLRDAHELSPHRRVEGKILEIAGTVEQGEQLLWFFDKGFDYRISDRFQSINELEKELKKFESPSHEEKLDLVEQFKLLDQAVTERDRNVQLALLKVKYFEIFNKINQSVQQSISQIKNNQAQLSITDIQIRTLRPEDQPTLEVGDLINGDHITVYILKRNHVKPSARVLMLAFGVGMQIHYYAASCVLQENNFALNTKKLIWEKVAVIEEDMESLTAQKNDVIVNYIKGRFAHEVRNITRQN